MMRLRAVLAEDKHERREAILDAAERLLRRSTERIANVAEVAEEAGLAKGTVYLYFPSKEELLLALHERHIDRFFAALTTLVEGYGPVTIEDVLALTQSHLVDEPTFLSLATRCFGIMGTEVPGEVAAAFKQRMFARLTRAGAGIERHFAGLATGDGVALLRHSYALILGLWQMSVAHEHDEPALAESCDLPRIRYPEELSHALRALWRGTLAPPAIGEAGASRKD